MLGLATIGQSPREDVVASMFDSAVLPAILQAGALDGIGREEIAGLQPTLGEHPLVTRLADGNEVVIAKERVTPLMNRAIRSLESKGATLTCVLCTGEFKGLSASRRIVYPDRVLAGVVDGLLPAGTIGVILPHSGQRQIMKSKWLRPGRQVELCEVSPYDGSREFGAAAARLVSSGAELIVMDCMGYSVDMQAEAQSMTDVPVVLANRMVGAVLAALDPALSGRLQNAL